ncbi:MAG: hypothetical protein K5899_09340 [Bacteroidaceae bacterium]|nr:hypothetical protein [Bacteroidaceae bacterium]
MRKLLLFFAMLCVSVGTWAGAAEGFEMREGDIGVWFVNNDPTPPEKVIKIEVTKEGGLKAALDELTAILTGEGEQKPHYANFRNKLDEAAQGGSDFLANNRLIVKVVFTGEGSLTLSNDDISALNSLNIPTIDLQDLKPASAFTLSNSNVKNLILPDQWTMAQVQAAATGCSNLNAALSIGTDVGAGEHADGTPVVLNVGSLVAYVNKPGTLYQSTRRLGYLLTDPNNNQNNLANNTKLGNVNPYTFALTGLKLVTIKGTPSARDFNGSTDTEAVKFDADGHFVFDKEADETKTDKDAAVGGGFRKLTGTTMTGALSGSNLTKLDLGDAIITDDHYSDLTISWSYSCVATSLKEIIFPTTSQLTKLPADCLNGDYSLLEELCIPGNIKVLKTRACYISTNIMRHVWTTGTTEHMVYDNGAYLVSDPDNADHYGHAPLDDTTWNNAKTPEGAPRYGTITLPEGLELIESHNFTARSVSDVYVLNVHAPECHVDAFSTIMYMGNNTIDTNYILEQGMVARQAYAQSVSKGEYISFLHYPRQSTTPDIQRYTDVTREYSVATTLRDGKGNVIYFPNQSELNRAYLQGTTGYLWYAWDSERVPGPAGNENSFKNLEGLNAKTEHTTAAQQQANGFYLANTMTDPDKTDRSFYDVRLDSDGQPSLNQPAGLDWYYKTKWENKQLYPEIVATQTETVIGQVQSQDAEGHLLYESGDCNYVQDYEYVQDNEGTLYWDRTVTPNDYGNYVQDYSYVQATNGAYYHPMVKETNKDQTLPSKYWYFATTGTYSLNPNGDYIYVNNTYVLIANAKSWWSWTDEQIAQYDRYSQDGSWTKVTAIDNTFWNVDLYYVSENYAAYSASGVVAGINETRYNKVYGDDYRAYNESTDAGEQRYDVVDNGLRAYNSETDTDNSKRYNKVYKDYTYREFDSSKDATDEPRYCPVMEPVYALEKGTQYDYRGWHQFILTAYATNDDRPFTPVKFYQTDNDWWTVCFPYDLTYSDMIKFFGKEDGSKPYLSKLRYVVRDYDKEKITLMFSKNLMEYKETITNPSATDDYVHGVIDDVTKWSADELADDPIILHKGVPYLIKPNIDVNAGRSFDVYQTETPELYQRLIDAQNVDGGALESYIYKGEYTVPAYVIGENAPEATVESRSFQHAPLPNSEGMSGGPKFTYNSSAQIMYGGEKVSARISSEFSYTFVGSFFLSLMPKDCYFLGWDSKKKCAAFWFNKTPNLSSYDWNNQTGIICPNFNTSLLIDPATSLSDPAKWTFGASDIQNDNLVGGTNGAKRGLTDMDWGEVDVVVTGIGKINVANNNKAIEQTDVIYDMQGVRMNRPLSRLPKGVYIVNGKKYVVE